MMEKMKERIKNWIRGILAEFVTEWLKKAYEESAILYRQQSEEVIKAAYDCGYAIGEEDANRRSHELFMFGVIQGYSQAKAEIGEISLDDLPDTVVRELKGGATNV